MSKNLGDRAMPTDPWTMNVDEFREWNEAWTPREVPEEARHEMTHDELNEALRGARTRPALSGGTDE